MISNLYLSTLRVTRSRLLKIMNIALIEASLLKKQPDEYLRESFPAPAIIARGTNYRIISMQQFAAIGNTLNKTINVEMFTVVVRPT